MSAGTSGGGAGSVISGWLSFGIACASLTIGVLLSNNERRRRRHHKETALATTTSPPAAVALIKRTDDGNRPNGLTAEEIAAFDRDGYLIVRGVLAAEELATAQRETAVLIEQVYSGGAACAWAKGIIHPLITPTHKSYHCITYLHAQQPNSFSVRMLAHPFLMNASRQLLCTAAPVTATAVADPNITPRDSECWVPAYDALIWKRSSDGERSPIVRWHRDIWGVPFVPTNSDSAQPKRLFNCGIHLDGSNRSAGGCVWFIPGTHTWSDEKCDQLLAQARKSLGPPCLVDETFVRAGGVADDPVWASATGAQLIPFGAVPVEVSAGDVVFHHPKILHQSDAFGSGTSTELTSNTESEWRRTYYFDNRSVEDAIATNALSLTEVQKRMTLLQYAIHIRYANTTPAPPVCLIPNRFRWSPPPSSAANHSGVDVVCLLSRDLSKRKFIPKSLVVPPPQPPPQPTPLTSQNHS